MHPGVVITIYDGHQMARRGAAGDGACRMATMHIEIDRDPAVGHTNARRNKTERVQEMSVWVAGGAQSIRNADFTVNRSGTAHAWSAGTRHGTPPNTSARSSHHGVRTSN